MARAPSPTLSSLSNPSPLPRSPAGRSPAPSTHRTPCPTSNTKRPISRRAAVSGFTALEEIDASRRAKMARYANDVLPDSDIDEDSPSPVLSAFEESVGAEGVLKMTNFTPIEVMRLWETVRQFMSGRWNVGRGVKCRQTPIDVLFMVLTLLKYGGQWDAVANIFQIKAPTFEKMTTKFLSLLSPHLYSLFVEEPERVWKMKEIVTAGRAFPNYPSARYAVDVTFQHTNMPGGNQAERADYYSAKHKLHGYKVKVSVLPTGLAINASSHSPGGVADSTIFRRNKSFHEAAMPKAMNEVVMLDEDPLRDTFPDDWSILADKGYQGLGQTWRVIHPRRRRAATPLTLDDEETNRRISSDKIIVENYFGRLCTLWGVCSYKYRWKETLYDTIFKACVALTNLHIRTHPLRANDGEHYGLYLRRLNGIGNERRKRRLEANRVSRERRALRLEASVLGDPTVEERYDFSAEY